MKSVKEFMGKIKDWHLAVAFLSALAVAIPTSRSVRHLNQPDVTEQVTYNKCLRFSGDGKLLWVDRDENGVKLSERFGVSTGTDDNGLEPGTITILEDATDDTMRLHVHTTKTPSLWRKTEDNVKRVDLVLHVNPNGKIANNQNASVWVTQKRKTDDEIAEAKTKKDREEMAAKEADRKARIERLAANLDQVEALIKEDNEKQKDALLKANALKPFMTGFAVPIGGIPMISPR
jgi:hypothetical protein